jgi:hypothetical protein
MLQIRFSVLVCSSLGSGGRTGPLRFLWRAPSRAVCLIRIPVAGRCCVQPISAQVAICFAVQSCVQLPARSTLLSIWPSPTERSRSPIFPADRSSLPAYSVVWSQQLPIVSGSSVRQVRCSDLAASPLL